MSDRAGFKRLVAVSAMALMLVAVVATSASAATVRVEEVTGPNNTATLVFQADPGEQNQVNLKAVEQPNRMVQMQIVDSGAAVNAGSGCFGGGFKGVLVICAMHAPFSGEYESCGRSCSNYKPGTQWTDYVKVDLGDGDNSFDGTTLGAGYPMVVKAGPGIDRISTGGGVDRVEPGAGNDEVHLGFGGGVVMADPTPDGNDLFDLGRGGFASYQARSTPVFLHGRTAGAAGESDSILGEGVGVGGGSADDVLEGDVTVINGGAGNDVLRGGQEDNRFYAGSGDDRLYGGGGDDELAGESGNDLVEGEAGNDEIDETVERYSHEPGQAPGLGDDVDVGGDGNDEIFASVGNDRADGGPGDDHLYGEVGDDQLSGGDGNDEISGESGVDSLAGGAGDDRLRAARVAETPADNGTNEPVDLAADTLDCGDGTDSAELNAWDRATNCEQRQLVRLIQLGKVQRDRAAGTASLPATVVGSGRLTVSGAGIRPVSRQIKFGSAFRPSTVIVVRARGKALKSLRRRGKVRVQLRTGFGPSATERRVEKRSVTLRLAPRPARR